MPDLTFIRGRVFARDPADAEEKIRAKCRAIDGGGEVVWLKMQICPVQCRKELWIEWTARVEAIKQVEEG